MIEGKRVRVLNGHTAKARFLNECEHSDIYKEIPRADINFPRDRYSYSETWGLVNHLKFGYVAVIETAHIRFEVWQVPELPEGVELKDMT